MELYLRDNDPTRTVMLEASGEELYKTDTPRGGATSVVRFQRQASVGLVSVQIGKVESTTHGGSNLVLCENGMEIVLRPPLDSEWAFVGPDGRPYKWQLMIRYPVLMLNDNSLTPIARYRRAKLGIVSRSRRAFLEILPAGVNIVDLVVVTFVSYAKQYLLPEASSSFES
ncbi:hypothetical protein FIBSPDRAFT_887618 [Athelia psychrophila]|uniref:DUF6593 domain-containing protein n=1 Tax=Athelia psychrophila TaxID=1759441 RepID=A0A166PBR3_9AGAM|nr:hypothetical protein FIBSPDRAFT_887618 [Fibularhizoctonia sp. CBS 109695]